MIGLRDDTGSAPPPTSHAPTLAAKIFAEDGWLQTGLKLDHRPQQEAMARAVAASDPLKAVELMTLHFDESVRALLTAGMS